MTSPRAYPRAERVRVQIQQVLAAEIERLRDPGLGYVTITEVTMSPDLRHAKAYYTVLSDETAVNEATKDALTRATPHLRSAIAQGIRLRYTPTLELLPDPVPAQGSRVDELLAQLRRADEDDA